MTNGSPGKVIRDIFPASGLPETLVVSGLKQDSRLVEPGDLFFAVPGLESDGRQFVKEAIRNGAVAVIYEEQGMLPVELKKGIGVPSQSVDGLNSEIGIIASRFYDNPSEKMKIIAITGTNGKTSCCSYISEALNELGVSCGVIGTLGYGIKDRLKSFGLTTPGATDVQKYLAEMLADGAGSVALEASSHGLDQGRLNGTCLRVAVFTNITRDHLDYHKDDELYRESKKHLFDFPELQIAVLNYDDSFGRELIGELEQRMQVFSFSTVNSAADVYCTDISQSEQGTSATVHSPWGEAVLTTRLYGYFNVSNLLAAMCVVCVEGFALDKVIRQLGKIHNVGGIMARSESPDGLRIVHDYAHTPDALSNVLTTLRSHCAGELWCLFGCGGERDRGKRPQMGNIAAHLSDHVVVTNDNPRHESAEIIIEDILSGVKNPDHVIVEPDRSQAIHTTIDRANSNDVVLIAGKGHEDYQEIEGERVHYSDYEEVRHAIG